MATQSYNDTLTQLRDNIENIRDVMNNNGLNGNDAMNTWPEQINGLIASSGSLLVQIEADNEDFDNIYDAIVEKGQIPTKTDRNTYAPAILAITTGGGDQQEVIDQLTAENEQLTTENEQLNQKVTDDRLSFDNIYDAIVEKGQTPASKEDTTTYPPAILAITTSDQELIDENNQLRAENESLTQENSTLTQENSTLMQENGTLYNQITNDDEDFDNIYNSIIAKNPSVSPIQNDRDTYAPAIDSISTGGGGGADFNIRYCDRLFSYGRIEVLEELNALCKNVISWNDAFNGTTLNDNTSIELDASSLDANFDLENNNIFMNFNIQRYYELNLLVKTSGNLKNLFNTMNSGNYGLISIIVQDKKLKNIQSLENMFYQCSGIKSFSIDAILTGVTSIANMFYQFNYNNVQGQMTELNLSAIGIDWEKITDAQYAFYRMGYISSIVASNFKFKNCNMNSMLKQCIIASVTLDIDDIVNNNINYDKTSLLENCANIINIQSTSDWKLGGSCYNMFSGCTKLTTIPNIKAYIKDNLSNLFRYMFNNCKALVNVHIEILKDSSINIENISRSYLTAQQMFYSCSELKNITGNLDLSYIYNYTSMFYQCSKLENIETTGSLAGESDSQSSAVSSLTLDLSASPVFNIQNYINSLAPNNSGKTRIIKLHSTVYNSLTDETKNIASSKNYTLQ